MKVGVVSDVHNNVDALSYALEQLAQCDLVLSLGDLISDYRVAPRVIQLAQDAGVLGIAGNHEKALLTHPGSTLRQRLAAEDLAYLQALPPGRDLTIDGRRLKLAHGAPWDDPDDYHCQYITARDAKALSRLRAIETDIVLLGHTHKPMSMRLDHLLVLNPGSCGESRDPAVGLTFAKLDFQLGAASTYRVRQGETPELMSTADF
jgi:putative phosphoesterase